MKIRPMQPSLPVAPARNTDPVTSHMAHKNLRPGTLQAKMLRGYYLLGDQGGISEDAFRAAADISPLQCWWHRSKDLRDAGLIESTGRMKPNTRTGEECQVDVITDAGIAEYYRLTR